MENENEVSMETLMAEQDAISEKLTTRQVVWVKVIQVTKDQVLVDTGEKREAVIPLSEFGPGESPAAGQRIPAVRVGPAKGPQSSVLSYRKAKTELAWEAAVKAFAEKSRVRGRVVSAIKGGFMVDVGGLSAFLPASLADLRPVREPARLVQTGVRCYIIELNEAKKQAVLSRKAVLVEENSKRRDKLLSELRVGEVKIGRILHAGPVGLTLDIGGIEGLVRTADIVWGAPKTLPTHVRGAKLRVKVLALPAAAGERVSLGIKQLSPNPADALRKKHPIKSIVRGKIVSAAPEGVQIRLDDGTPAFATAVDAGENVPKAGESVSAVIVGIDVQNFHILVSLEKYNEIQDRKRLAQYLKAPAPLTLGQLLSPDREGSGGA